MYERNNDFKDTDILKRSPKMQRKTTPRDFNNQGTIMARTHPKNCRCSCRVYVMCCKQGVGVLVIYKPNHHLSNDKQVMQLELRVLVPRNMTTMVVAGSAQTPTQCGAQQLRNKSRSEQIFHEIGKMPF